MTPELLRRVIVYPTLFWLSDEWGEPKFLSFPAEDLLVAIAIQESGLKQRYQQPHGGPARSFWQIEPPTARAVIDKWPPAGRIWEDMLCGAALSETLACCDAAACAIARGILWLNPKPLPNLRNGELDAGWEYYLECWRPGKPRPEAWSESVQKALA